MRLFYVTLVISTPTDRNLVHSQTVLAADTKDAVKTANTGKLEILASKVEDMGEDRIARNSVFHRKVMSTQQVLALHANPEWTLYAHDKLV